MTLSQTAGYGQTLNPAAFAAVSGAGRPTRKLSGAARRRKQVFTISPAGVEAADQELRPCLR
jgi:hypothetical protein